MQPEFDKHLREKSLFLLPHFAPSGSFLPESAGSLPREELHMGEEEEGFQISPQVAIKTFH